MSADHLLDHIAREWLAMLPATKEEGEAVGFDGRTWLADWLEVTARDKADKVFLGLDAFMEAAPRTLTDLDEHIMEQGFALIEAWGATMAVYGALSETWVRAAADRAVMAYRERVELLLTIAGDGGHA